MELTAEQELHVREWLEVVMLRRKNCLVVVYCDENRTTVRTRDENGQYHDEMIWTKLVPPKYVHLAWSQTGFDELFSGVSQFRQHQLELAQDKTQVLLLVDCYHPDQRLRNHNWIFQFPEDFYSRRV